jgi:hypothetical protein
MKNRAVSQLRSVIKEEVSRLLKEAAGWKVPPARKGGAPSGLDAKPSAFQRAFEELNAKKIEEDPYSHLATKEYKAQDKRDDEEYKQWVKTLPAPRTPEEYAAMANALHQWRREVEDSPGLSNDPRSDSFQYLFDKPVAAGIDPKKVFSIYKATSPRLHPYDEKQFKMKYAELKGKKLDTGPTDVEIAQKAIELYDQGEDPKKIMTYIRRECKKVKYNVHGVYPSEVVSQIEDYNQRLAKALMRTMRAQNRDDD